MRSDRRVQYTKKAIREAFLSLLESSPLEDVTVKEICCIADINRATFYRNYADLYALYDAIEEEMLSAAFPDTMKSFSILDFLLLIQENKAFYREVYRKGKVSASSLKIIGRYRAEVQSMLRPDMDPELYDTCLRFAVYGVSGLLRDWLESDCKEDARQIARQIDFITSKLYT